MQGAAASWVCCSRKGRSPKARGKPLFPRICSHSALCPLSSCIGTAILVILLVEKKISSSEFAIVLWVGLLHRGFVSFTFLPVHFVLLLFYLRKKLSGEMAVSGQSEIKG